jgi:hypothetical protein
VTWFRHPVPEQMRQRAEQMLPILEAHGIACEMVWSDDPGTVVYEDQSKSGSSPTCAGSRTRGRKA